MIPQEMLDVCNGNHIIASALIARGIDTKKRAVGFLDADLYEPADPYDFPDMEKATTRINKAIKNKERIGIWGDFDVDGQTSTTLLVEYLKMMGADHTYHVPVRGPENHGINLPGLKRILTSGVTLLITCDTGISAHEAIDYCNAQNVDVVITDHHSLPINLPDAFAIINPKSLSKTHPFHGLAGVGTAFQLAKALLESDGRGSHIEELLDLVALGTVADVADLLSEGHFLASAGIRKLRSSKRPGLTALLKIAEITQPNLTEDHISYHLAPRLNAIGRLSDANKIIKFLLTDDPEFAQVYANEIESFNNERKILVDQVYKAAIKQIEGDNQFDHSPMIFLSHASWPPSVVGIVASRLVEKFQKPAFLFHSPHEGRSSGSARSVAGLDIISAISENQDVLLTFGGHPMAAGLSLETSKLPFLKKKLEKSIIARYGTGVQPTELLIDYNLPLPEANPNLATEIERLAPFGSGNPKLVFISPNVHIKSKREIGRNREHLQLLVEDDQGFQSKVLFWNGTDYELPAEIFDLAYSLRMSNYLGRSELTIEWVDCCEHKTTIDLDTGYDLTIHDHRNDMDFEKDLLYLAGQPRVEIYFEGTVKKKFQVRDRNNITPTSHLVLASPPPTAEVLRQIITQASPREITLSILDVPSDDLFYFLSTLLGLLKYTLNKKDSKLDIDKMAALVSQDTATIKKGLEVLERNQIINLDPARSSVIKMGDKIILNESEPNFLYLKNILKETAAFREFYCRISPENFLILSRSFFDKKGIQ